MIRRLLLIDYENIQHFDLAELDADVDIVVFLGAEQKLQESLRLSAKALGDRVMWLRMGGTGPNALDFHIACYLGRTLEMNKKYTCFVLSNDRGFDPLLKHLNELGMACLRIDNLAALGLDLSPEDEAVYKKVAEALRKQPKAQRPKSRLALIKWIASHYRRRPVVLQLNSILARLLKNKLLVLRDDDTISYG